MPDSKSLLVLDLLAGINFTGPPLLIVSTCIAINCHLVDFLYCNFVRQRVKFNHWFWKRSTLTMEEL